MRHFSIDSGRIVGQRCGITRILLCDPHAEIFLFPSGGEKEQEEGHWVVRGRGGGGGGGGGGRGEDGSLFTETVAMIVMIKCGVSMHLRVQSSEIDEFGVTPPQS